MVEFKAVINDPKSGKAHARTIAGNMAPGDRDRIGAMMREFGTILGVRFA